MDGRRGTWTLAILLVCLLAAYAANFPTSGASMLPVFPLGVTTVATLSVFVLDGSRPVRLLALVGIALTLTATAANVWSYSHWSLVEAGNFQTSAAAVWYASMYCMLVLPVLVAIAACMRIGRRVLSAGGANA